MIKKYKFFYYEVRSKLLVLSISEATDFICSYSNRNTTILEYYWDSLNLAYSEHLSLALNDLINKIF